MSTKYITMAADETLWVCTTTGNQLGELIKDPAAWVQLNAPLAQPSVTGHYFIEFSTSTPADGSLVIRGMSGTALIIVSGHETALPAFAANLGISTNPAQFWSTLDSVLASKLEFPKIEFFLLREFNRLFVHLQLNPDKQFIAVFMSAIAQDQAGYIAWLQNTTGIVPRELKELLPNGAINIMPMSKLTIIPKGTYKGGAMQDARMFFENLSAVLCPEEFPNLVACGGADGPIVEDTTSGTTAEPELIFIKMYCMEEGVVPGP